MAVKDFRKYLGQVQSQYLTLKQNLADFDEAFKNGYITEDKLDSVKNELYILEQNYQRLIYVEYLLNLPNRKAKKARAAKADSRLVNHFTAVKADSTSVIRENNDALVRLRAELKNLEQLKKSGK